MIDPLTALIVAILLIAITWGLFAPRHGLVPRLLHSRRLSGRVLIEDALKHLYACETDGRSPSIESLSGALGIPRQHSADLLERVESLGLVHRRGADLVLTEEGRSEALHVLRVHRLWERYLAEETGLSESEWHSKAEQLEHGLTQKEADRLASSLQHPAFDPHGDPIPSQAGEMPPPSGRPLPSFTSGDSLRIVHLEDEPRSLYAQLVAEGMFPGMRVRMGSVDAHRVRFFAGGEEHVLAPVVAASCYGVPLVDESRNEVPGPTLAQLKVGETSRVHRLSFACRGLERRRLLDLGILPGTAIRAELRNSAGDLTAYRVRETLIALRPNQARHILIDSQRGRP